MTRRRMVLLALLVALGAFLWWGAQPAVDEPHPDRRTPTEVSP